MSKVSLIKKCVIGAISLVLVVVVVLLVTKRKYKTYEISDADYIAAYELLYNSIDDKTTTYFEYIRNKNIDYTLIEHTATNLTGELNLELDYEKPVNLLEYNSVAKYQVEVDRAGLYYIEVDYKVIGDPLSNLTMALTLNGETPFDEADLIDLPLYWQDESKDFPLDTYKDETLPRSVRLDKFVRYGLYNNKYSTSTPLMFYFSEGLNDLEFTLLSSNAELVLGDVFLTPAKKTVDYQTYINNYQNVEEIKGITYVNAIDYSEKNSSYIRMASLNSKTATPFKSNQRVLNIIDGTSWNSAGQTLSYDITVEETGLYELAFHYRNDSSDMNVFRTIYINDEIYFDELYNYAFPNTGGSYANLVLGNEETDFKFYFEKNKTYKLTLKAEVNNFYTILDSLQLVIDHINQLALDIIKITGNDIDEDRTWEMTKYLPLIPDYLNAYDVILKNIIDEGEIFSENGANSSMLSYVQKALSLLENIKEKPDEIPLHLGELYNGKTMSMTLLLGENITLLENQQLHLDGIYVGNGKLKSANANFIVKGWYGFVNLLNTFFNNKYKTKLDKEVINIWINRPTTYINTLQKLIDSDFNVNNDIEVQLSAMPDQNKLVLAIAADNAPDIAMGTLSHIPYDLAIRSGLYDLSSFPDFWEVADRFSPGSLVSFIIEDKVYALPETLDFNTLVYRSDIFKSLNIDPDINTWDDVIGILPTLQRYGMNFYLPIAADNGTKWFYQTTPLIYQAGGRLYSEDGLTTSINSVESVKGLSLLISLFTERSLTKQDPSFFNSFRNGKMPVGILDFSGYLRLLNAAPEIKDKWSLLLPPGMESDEGEINRTFIANGTSAFILENTEYPEECWEFLKWWTSKNVQAEFAYLLESSYGPEYVWLSSNLEAIADSSIEEKHKRVILEAVEWITDVPRVPGSYMTERGLSDIWTATVLSGDAVMVAISNKTISINREIRRKMQEFGYLDSDGNVLKAYSVREKDWIIQMIEESKEL